MFIPAAKVFRFRKLLRQFYIKSLQRQRIISKFAENFANGKIHLNMIQLVEKRDGRVVGYNEEKIKAAIRKAMLTT